MFFFRLYSKKTIFVGKDSSMDDKWKALEKYNLWGGNTYQLGLERKSYTDKIGNFVGNNLVKVLIGQRRSGKSYILRQIASSLVSERGVNPANILYINKEYLEFDFIDDYKALESLYRFYREKLKPQGKVYLFFDEIQNVDGWERFVNSHSQDFVEESELFISGSNSKMLSSELATLLSGRYVEFHIFPYSYGSPDKSGGKFFNSIENLHLCTMNNQGLLALAQLILPSEILSNFEVVRVEEEASLIRIYLDESVKAEYKESPEIESKGFCEAVTIRDFPIRDKGVDLIVRRRKWYDKQNNRYFSDSYELKAEGTRYSKEFAAFLKGVYGDDSYDLPFA